MGLWGKIKHAVGGNTGRGALMGSMIDPVGGGLVGGLAGKHKKNHSAAGPATAPPNTVNFTPPPQGAPIANPYFSQQSLPNIDGQKGTPPQAQGPMTGSSISSMQGKGAPPSASLGGGGPMTQQAAAPMKGQ